MTEEDCVWPPTRNNQDPKKIAKTDAEDCVWPPHQRTKSHASKDMKPYIVEALEKLRKKEVAAKQPFKARAYATVLAQIKLIDDPITSMEQLKNIKGVGEKIQVKLQEIFDTGKLTQVQEYDTDHTMQLFDDLMQIYGVGPAKARELIDKAGIKSVDELYQKQELLNDVQKKGLKYYKDTMLRIPRAEMEKHEAYIMSVIKTVGGDITAALSGSYRRKEQTSGDIDCLITNCDEATFKKIIHEFVAKKYITDVLAQGNKKVLAVGKLRMRRHYRRIDFMLTNESEYPFALLYFTGSGPFNVAMRNHALSKGYSLSEHGLKDAHGTFVSGNFKTEHDIFKFLGLKYIEPEQRIKNVAILSPEN